MHPKRRFSIESYADPLELASKLTGPRGMTWTSCTGFRWSTLTLLNDSTCEDALQEYAVIRDGRQIESLTVSWMEPDRLAAMLRELELGGGADYGPVAIREHEEGACHACA